MQKISSNQVRDDTDLLDLMVKDSQSVSDLYKPTNYWEILEKNLLPELKTKGLHNFRRRKNSVISFLNHTDLLPISWVTQDSHRKPFKVINSLVRNFSKRDNTKKLMESIIYNYSGVTLEDLRILCYEFAKIYGEQKGAKSLEKYEPSLLGNPENVFELNGKTWVFSALNHYLQYSYCCNFMDFDSINSIMELGGGFGKQIELIKKFHPHVSFYLFDLAPQLYISEQYLSSVFPDSVISYRETREMKEIPKKTNGKIFIFGNWRMSDLENLSCDVFWNSASFQEMEPNVVLNYLKYINQLTEKSVFLHARSDGSIKIPKKGAVGVLEQTNFDHYKKGLNQFEMIDMTKARTLPRLSEKNHYFSFWKKIK